MPPKTDTWQILATQFITVRDSGSCHVFDRPCIEQVANDLGLHELKGFARVAHVKQFATLLKIVQERSNHNE